MKKQNNNEENKWDITQDFLPSDGASCSESSYERYREALDMERKEMAALLEEKLANPNPERLKNPLPVPSISSLMRGNDRKGVGIYRPAEWS